MANARRQRTGPYGMQARMSGMGVRRRGSWVGALMSLGSLVVSACPARAGESEATEDAMRRGTEFRRQGEDEKALRVFTKIYQETQSPRALAQMGLAEQALGRWVD